MGNAAETFNKYLDAFSQSRADEWQRLIADDFVFVGPLLQSEGKPAFLEGAAQLCPVVRGYKMLRQWEDGDTVCSIFDFQIETPVGSGAVTMADWTTVRDGKMVASRVLFNGPDFAALMPTAG